MPAIVMAIVGLSMLAREASRRKARTKEVDEHQKRDTVHDASALEADNTDAEKDWGGSLDSYASSQNSKSAIQRTDSKLSGGVPQLTYSREVIASPTSLSHDPPELVQTASTCSSSPTESSGNTTSDVHAVRVRTKGHDLKSGFPYHPGLYDLHVRPDDWQRFSDQLTDCTKFDSGDYAKLWATVGSLALTGSILTSVWVGRTMNRSIQEKKVETGLVDTSPGSLGETLEHWNASYFAPLGLCAHLELSDSAMRKPKQKSSIVRKPSLLYKEREERERKREDRKFVVVITRLEHASQSTTGIHELAGDIHRAEMPVPGDPRCHTAELPGDTNLRPLELPTSDDQAKEDVADVICGISEVPGDLPTELHAEIPIEGSLWPRPLAVVSAKTVQG